jgi:hypothetical protein
MVPAAVPHPAEPVEIARERVVRLLTDRYADDSLTMGEFEAHLERLQRAEDADTLAALARELEAPRQRAQGAWLSENAPPPPVVTAWPVEERIVAVLGEVTRRGALVLARRLSVVAVMGELRLDLSEATFPECCELSLVACMATVRLVVPDSLSVRVEVTSLLSSMHDATSSPALPGHARLVVRGAAAMSDLHVVPASARPARRRGG